MFIRSYKTHTNTPMLGRANNDKRERNLGYFPKKWIGSRRKKIAPSSKWSIQNSYTHTYDTKFHSVKLMMVLLHIRRKKKVYIVAVAWYYNSNWELSENPFRIVPYQTFQHHKIRYIVIVLLPIIYNVLILLIKKLDQNKSNSIYPREFILCG